MATALLRALRRRQSVALVYGRVRAMRIKGRGARVLDHKREAVAPAPRTEEIAEALGLLFERRMRHVGAAAARVFKSECEARAEALSHILLASIPRGAASARLRGREPQLLLTHRERVVELVRLEVREVGDAALHAQVKRVDVGEADLVAEVVARGEASRRTVLVAALERSGRDVDQDWHDRRVARGLVGQDSFAELKRRLITWQSTRSPEDGCGGRRRHAEEREGRCD